MNDAGHEEEEEEEEMDNDRKVEPSACLLSTG